MWQQLTLHARSEDCEELEDKLLTQGAVSITYLDAEDQPVFQEEPGSTPMWDNTVLLALFTEDTDLTFILAALRNEEKILNREQLTAEPLADQAWERSWMDSFQPMRFGKRLWICPSWQSPPEPEAVNLFIDPGLAFGSGTHHTTAMCLTWLDSADVAGKTLIDYGCGSGVLALAAALLDAKVVHAVDNDPQAILATRDNAQRNSIAAARIPTYLPAELPDMQADILLANILAAPLQLLAATFAQLLKPGGQLVLSGLLTTQIDDVTAAYQSWVDFAAPVIDADWVCLTGTRRA